MATSHERRPCHREDLELPPLLNGTELRLGDFAGVPRLALPPGPGQCTARAPPGRVLLRSELEPHRRFLVAFPAGGEVFALGVLGRMPLADMELELEPAVPWSDAPTSPWVMLRHVQTGLFLEIVQPRAAEAAWMVRLTPRARIAQRGELFCIDPSHGLYSHAARGYVNVRNQVLLRGHDRPNTPAGRVASSRLSVLRVQDAAAATDAAYWRCVHEGLPLPGPAGSNGGGSNSGSSNGGSANSVAAGNGKRSPAGGAGALHVLTYATKATPMLCDALLVALVQRVPLTLIGYGDTYQGNFQKLTSARQVVAALPPDALVLFADAYDVLYTAGGDALRAGFEGLGVPPDRVLFMGERGCWPDADMGPVGHRFCSEQYPKSPTPYRYVNSGVWMGRAAAAFRLLTVLSAYTPGLDDQHVTGHLFVDRNDWFALDRHATLFQSMHGSADDVHATFAAGVRGGGGGGGGSGGGEAPHAGAAVARNSLTNSTPRVLHFNGGAKDQFKRYRDHLLSRAPCLPVGSSIATPGGELPFKEICPRHPLPSLKRAC